MLQCWWRRRFSDRPIFREKGSPFSFFLCHDAAASWTRTWN